MKAVALPSQLVLPLSACIIAGIGITALGTAGIGLIDGDYLPTAIVFATIVVPFALFATAQAVSWNEPYATLYCVAIITLQSAVFRIRDIDDKSVDSQIILKLACLALMAGMVVSALTRRRAPFSQPSDIVLWLLFLLYLLATTLISVDPKTAMIECISNVFGFFFLLSISFMLSPRRLVESIVWACFCLCLMSMTAYVLDPQLGRMSDWVNGAFVPTSRLQGVFGTANAAGAAGAFGLVTLLLLAGYSKRRLAFWMLAVPFATCMILSNNRMAVGASIAALTLVYVKRRGSPMKIAIAIFLLSLGALLFANYGDFFLEKLSRSGSADEITSGTGRTRIWAVVIDLWTQRPIFGYGAGSAKYILPHHPLLFLAAAHAHNLYLNILFAGGLVGLGIFLLNVGSAIRRLWRKRSDNSLGLIFFFLVYGITEPTIGGLVSFISISFYAVIVFSFYPEECLLSPGKVHSKAGVSHIEHAIPFDRMAAPSSQSTS